MKPNPYIEHGKIHFWCHWCGARAVLIKPSTTLNIKESELEMKSLTEQVHEYICKNATKFSSEELANMVRYFTQEQAKEISSLKKQIHQLSVSREPKIGDRVILLDDESEGVIESLSIAGGPRINFDDGAYGNYTRLELITLFAYKEKE
jgi:hypothetical protein